MSTKIKALFIVFILFFMISASRAEHHRLLISTDSTARENACSNISDSGERTLCYIKYDYNNVPSRCEKNDNEPGVWCSGLVIRGTSSDLDREYNSWNPSPASVTSGGVSFSYLRKDSKFGKLAYGYVTGFIFHPKLYTPSNKDYAIKILCGFPLDAGTDRRSDKGCGEYDAIANSMPCQDQGIDNASKWIDVNYANAGGNREHTCGFMLYSSNEEINSSEGFDAMIKSQILLKEVSFSTQNELRLETWSQDKSDIPIEAFFYIAGNSSGLSSSQKDQSDFYNQYGDIIPIIGISLPSSMEDEVEFYYNTSDQMILGDASN